MAESKGGGLMDWLPSILGLGGSIMDGVVGASQGNADRHMQADMFNAQYGMQQDAMRMLAANMMNRAPLADKGQYLAMNRAAPTAFRPRDPTRGGSMQQTMRAAPQGGAQAQMAANRQAANNYRPGAGGVDTSALSMVLSRLGGPKGMTNNATTTTNYGGKEYTAEEWSQYLNEHPEVARTGV